MGAPTLAAPSPAAWFEAHAWGRDRRDGRRCVRVDELLADGAAHLHTLFADELVEGWVAPAAATGIADAYAGGVARIVGFAIAGSGAHWLVDPGGVRWWLDPAEGWSDAIDLLDPHVLVPSDHPWAGQPGVEVDDDAGRCAERAMAALVAAVAPIIEACHGLTKVGRNGLWATVVDAVAASLMYQTSFEIERDHVAVLQRMVAVRPAPWRGAPEVFVEATHVGDVCIAARSGCCLAYMCDWPEDHEDDDAHRAYFAAFPEAPDARGLCADCSLRPLDDCTARQVWWRVRELEERTAS